MAELNTTRTFVDGDTVNAAAMNNIVDQASALKGIILDQPLKLPPLDTLDGVLIYDSVTGDLARTGVTALPGVSSVGLTMPTSEFTVTGSPVTASGTLTATWKTQTLQKFLASPTGATGVPVFREMTASDLALPPVSIASDIIGWANGVVFVKVLTVNPTAFSMISMAEGQSITVFVSQGVGGYAVSWPAARWPGGSAPTQSTAAGATDIYQFWYLGATLFGARIGTNLLP